MKKILTTCEAQFHQNMSGNFTADCSSGAVQGYGDCLGDAVGCTDVADATERMLNYEYGYTANQEEDEELEKRQLGNRGRPGRIQCRFHCYPSKSQLNCKCQDQVVYQFLIEIVCCMNVDLICELKTIKHSLVLLDDAKLKRASCSSFQQITPYIVTSN